ncbi:MAG: hypothetical protein Q7T79_02355 [bacterium]|nr:hypothetical protein [bacterium]
MPKIVKRILILSCLIAILVLPYFVFANTVANPVVGNLMDVGGGGKGPYENIPMIGIIGLVVRIVLSLLGIVFLILMVYAGFSWMTAAGEEERVTKAKETITRAIIGLIITIGSYAIWIFVSTYLL